MPQSHSPDTLQLNLGDFKEHFDSLEWERSLSVLLVLRGTARAKLTLSHLPEVWFVLQRWSPGK